MSYQNLTKLNGNEGLYGTPSYQGLEYDFEVPDSHIVQSPGGASTTHHHWSHGIYGAGASDSNKFGFQGYRTDHGINGNLYQPGLPAADSLGLYPGQYPDAQYWNNQPPPPGSVKDSFFDSLDTAKLELPKDIKKDEIIETFAPNEEKKGGLANLVNLPLTEMAYFVLSVVTIVVFTLFFVKYYEQRYGTHLQYKTLLIMGVVLLVVVLVMYLLKSKEPTEF
jgi:hypothetical protein